MKRLSRRTLLRGVGASVALPWLEATASERAVPPKRFAWIYIPNGVVQDRWHPKTPGPDWEVTPTLEPLAPYRKDLNLFTGLDREFRGGTGVHAQAGCCWLTSSPPTEALDGGFPTNTTVDQLVARRFGADTLLPSLELSCNDHDNQKETKYFETLSWYEPGYAAGALKNPRDVFNRLFGRPDRATRGVVDAVLEDARSLERSLGTADRDKLGEFLESVRGLEKRIDRGEARETLRPPLKRPDGIPGDRGEYIRLMGRLMALAFQMDLTRVATLLIDPERWDTPRMYHGVFDGPENHHVLTHTKGEEAKEKLARIDRFHVTQFADLVGRLKKIREGEGSLLDNCLVSFGSGMGDGRVHDYNNLPVITAGGLFRTGNHHVFEGKVPVANLWRTGLEVAGVRVERFADSTGTIPGLVP